MDDQEIGLAMPEKKKPENARSLCLEPKRKRIRRSSLAWKGYKSTGVRSPLGSGCESFCGPDALYFSSIEQEITKREKEIDTKLKNNNILSVSRYNCAEYGPMDCDVAHPGDSSEGMCDMVMQECAKKGAPSKSEECPSIPCLFGKDAKGHDLEAVKYEKHSLSCENEIACVTSSATTDYQNSLFAYDSKKSKHKYKLEDSTIIISSTGPGELYVQRSGTSSNSLKSEGTCEKCFLKIRQLEEAVAVLEKESKAKDMAIENLEKENEKVKSDGIIGLKRTRLMRTINRMLRQSLVYMYEKYRASRISQEEFDYGENEMLVRRAIVLISELGAIYNENTTELHEKYKKSIKEGIASKADLECYKEITRELVKRIRNEKSAIDLVYDLKKDLG